MFSIFTQKSREYGLYNQNLFIGSKATTNVEYNTKQEVSFNLSERKNYQLFEYAVKWISYTGNRTNQAEAEDIYIVWPIKDSKCKALTLSSSDFRRTYQNSGLQTIHKKSKVAEYDIWLFRRKNIDKFFQEIMVKKCPPLASLEVIENQFDKNYSEGEKSYGLSSFYERDPNLRREAINKFRYEHDGELFCSICGFDFSRKYGKYGADFIEVHHITPLSEDERGLHNASVDELICVCSNCHSMIHHKSPAMKPEELKALIKLECKRKISY